MKTLVKGANEQLIEGGSGPNCRVVDTTWNPDHEIPYWAIWSSTGAQQRAYVHLKHYTDAVLVAPTATVEEREGRELFERLAANWETETEFVSRQSQAVMHPAYQRIIGIGPAAIPWLLERLRDQPDNWFWALAAITGEDPGKGCASLADAREAWLHWGDERGYLF
jgi:hypothetical protein